MSYGRATIVFQGRGPLGLNLSVPATTEEMERGLQGFAFGPGEGMLFLSRRWPQEEQIPMWQASVNVPLAMIWLGKHGSVRDIEKVVMPGDPRTFDYCGIACVECHADVAARAEIDVGTPFVLEYP